MGVFTPEIAVLHWITAERKPRKRKDDDTEINMYKVLALEIERMKPVLSFVCVTFDFLVHAETRSTLGKKIGHLFDVE